MIELIDNRREQIADLCRRHGIRRLDVFGSAATGSFDPASSDVDFLAEFEGGQAADGPLDGPRDGPVTLGSITVGCALGYLDLRFPEDDWRAGHPKLAAWYEGFSQRPSMQASEPPS